MRPKPHIAPPYFPPVRHGDPTVTARPIPGYYQVREYTCGFASTLMVLHAFRRYVEPRELYDRLGTDYTGTSQSAIVRELRREGLSVNLHYDVEFGGLREIIDQRRLAIGYHHRLEHWVVLYGYGVAPERVFVADPIRSMRSEQPWQSYGPKLRGFAMEVGPRRRRARALRA